jgi:hypothetical protein
MKFPKCNGHQAAQWFPQQMQRGNDSNWYEYEQGLCLHCNRPLVAFAPDFPASERAFTRRHVAWRYLDKEGEDGRNTSVMPWRSTIPELDGVQSFEDFCKANPESRW